MATNVTDTTFETEVSQADEPVLVDFWAEWCGRATRSSPCSSGSPRSEDDLKLVKVNIDENQELAMRYGIQSIPNMMLFEGGAPRPPPSARCRRGCSSDSSASELKMTARAVSPSSLHRQQARGLVRRWASARGPRGSAGSRRACRDTPRSRQARPAQSSSHVSAMSSSMRWKPRSLIRRMIETKRE